MKKIIVLIDDQTNLEVIIKSAIDLAKLLTLEITLCHIVFAPYNWDKFSRTSKDSLPESKIKINAARLVMDEILSKIRFENLKAKKQFLYFDQNKYPHELCFNSNELVLMEKKFVTTNHAPKLVDFLLNCNCSKLFIDQALDVSLINDIVFCSNFHALANETVDLLNDLFDSLDFNLNLVYINTKEQQENSEISISNMKSAIASNGLSRTSISIFHSDYKIQGAEQFANMKGGDFIVMECANKIHAENLKNLKLPLLIINPHK